MPDAARRLPRAERALERCARVREHRLAVADEHELDRQLEQRSQPLEPLLARHPWWQPLALEAERAADDASPAKSVRCAGSQSTISSGGRTRRRRRRPARVAAPAPARGERTVAPDRSAHSPAVRWCQAQVEDDGDASSLDELRPQLRRVERVEQDELLAVVTAAERTSCSHPFGPASDGDHSG